MREKDRNDTVDINMDPLQKKMLDDVFDAFTMLTDGGMVTLMHVDGGFTRYTKSAVELFGLPGEYIPNGAMNWADYLHPEDRKRYMDAMAPLLSGGTQAYDITYRVRTVSGEYAVFRAVGAVLRGESGAPSLIGGALFNEGLTNSTDPVTVLPNKHAFADDLSKRISSESGVLALQVGISGFSEINRVHGYSYGNRILQETAWQIQETLGGRGSVYRLDGAAFGVLSDSLTREEMSAIYDHIRYRLQRGVEVNGLNNVLTANGGLISTYSSDVDASAIMSCLNYAYEESASRKHGALVDFNGGFGYETSEFLEMFSVIRECVYDGCKGFGVEYVPVVSAETGVPTGVEATFYWEDERYGKIDSATIMPILERDFVFEELGDFVLSKSLSDAVKLLERDPDFFLCINAYRLQLESDYYVDSVLLALEESGFPASQLSLKLGGDCRYVGIERMKDIIDALHENGILAIIGDFGGGTDSISFLKSELPDAVSISAHFVDEIADDPKSRELVGYLTKMASCYVEHVNVAGIDNEKLRDIVSEMSVTTMQGAYFSEPLSFDQLVEKYYSA